MVLGTIYVVFVAHNFLGQFEGFLITLGVPIAAWCGIMLADIMLRRKDYSEPELYDPRGRYGDIRLAPLAIIVIGTVVGWGLVTNTYASWLTWQGYLLGPLGLGGKTGAWAFANLGVLVALVFGFVAGLGARRRAGPGPGVPARAAPRPRPRARREQPRGLPGGHRHAAGVRRAGQRLAGPAVRRDRRAGPRPGGGVPARTWCSPGSSRPPSPAGAWRHYYEAWPFALQPPDARIYQLVDEFAAGRRADPGRDHVQQVGPGTGRPGRPGERLVLAGVSTDCCVLSTALAAADAGVAVQVVADACAGVADDSHRKALDILRLYAPLVEVVSLADVLGG